MIVFNDWNTVFVLLIVRKSDLDDDDDASVGQNNHFNGSASQKATRRRSIALNHALIAALHSAELERAKEHGKGELKTESIFN